MEKKTRLKDCCEVQRISRLDKCDDARVYSRIQDAVNQQMDAFVFLCEYRLPPQPNSLKPECFVNSHDIILPDDVRREARPGLTAQRFGAATNPFMSLGVIQSSISATQLRASGWKRA